MLGAHRALSEMHHRWRRPLSPTVHATAQGAPPAAGHTRRCCTVLPQMMWSRLLLQDRASCKSVLNERGALSSSSEDRQSGLQSAVLESPLKMTACEGMDKSASKRRGCVGGEITDQHSYARLFALCKLCAFGAFGPAAHLRHGLHVAGGPEARPPCCRISDQFTRPARRSSIRASNPELSLGHGR